MEIAKCKFQNYPETFGGEDGSGKVFILHFSLCHVDFAYDNTWRWQAQDGTRIS
jgi:hypothetical protein